MELSSEKSRPAARHLKKWRVPLGLWLALFTVSFSVNLMTVLVVPITRALGTHVGSVQSVPVVFALVMAAFVPAGQGLGNVYGHWRVFRVGQLVFCLGLAATALSPHVVMLVMSYGIVSGLAVTPLVTLPWMLANLSFRRQGRARDLAFLALGMAVVTGGLVGPFVGGYLTTATDWRWAFAPPIAMMAAIFVLVRPAREIVRKPGTPVDVVGGLLSFIGIVAILLGLNLANEYGWLTERKPLFRGLSPDLPISIAPILIVFGMFVLFLFVFHYRRRRLEIDRMSIWNLVLYRDRTFTLGLVTSLLYTIGTAGLTFCLYLFLQVAYDLTPFGAALAVSPYYLAMLAVLVATVWLGRLFRPRNVIRAGLALLVAGLWPLAQAITRDSMPLWLAPGLAVMGTGAGLVISQMANLTQSRASFDRYGESSGIYGAVQDLAYALGISIFGPMLVYLVSAAAVDGVAGGLGFRLSEAERNSIVAELEESLQVLSEQELQAAIAQLPGDVQAALADVTLGAEIAAMQQTLGGIAIALLMALAISIFLPPAEHSGGSD